MRVLQVILIIGLSLLLSGMAVALVLTPRWAATGTALDEAQPIDLPFIPELKRQFKETYVHLDSRRFSLALDFPDEKGVPSTLHVLLGDLNERCYAHVQIRDGYLKWFKVIGDSVELVRIEPLSVTSRKADLNPDFVLCCYQDEVQGYRHRSWMGSSPLASGKLFCAVYSPEDNVRTHVQNLPDLYLTDGFMRRQIGSFDAWSVEGGSWQTRATAKDINATPNPFVLIAQQSAKEKRPAVIRTGRPYWGNYDMEISFRRASDTSDVGMIFAANQPGSGYQVSVGGGNGDEVIRLERIENDRTALLSEQKVSCPPSKWFRLGVSVGADSMINGKIDGHTLIRHRALEMLAGEVGIRVAQGKAEFDDFLVTDIGARRAPMRPVVQKSRIYSQKANVGNHRYRDDLLHRWTRGSDIWERSTATIDDKKVAGYLNRNVLFGDFELKYAPAYVSHLALRSPGNGVLHSFQCPVAADRKPSIFRRKGNMLYWQGRPIAPLPSGRGVQIGVYATNKPGPRDPRPEILSRNVWYEFFETSPTDWYALSGVWKIANRWACNKKWNYYQGVGPDAVVSFSKHRYEGNQVHELYHSLKDVLEGRPQKRGRPRYARHDVNISFCTNGKDLNSGYTLLFGGFGNKGTYLVKGDTVVAVNEHVKFPKYKGRPHDIHWMWWRLRIEKLDDLIRVRWDDKLVFEYRDPDPLPGGHIALWTFRNGNIYALLRSAAEKRVNDSGIYLASRHRDAKSPWEPLEPDRVACRRAGQGKYRVTNLMGGGRFAVRWKLKKPIDIRKTPVLRIPFRAQAGARVSLHVRVSGTPLVVPITGPVKHTYELLTQKKTRLATWQIYDSRPLGLPYVEATSCHQPARAEIRIDLLREVRKRLPRHKLYLLEDLVIGNTSNEDYLMAGFNGNESGAGYMLGEPAFTTPGAVLDDDSGDF